MPGLSWAKKPGLSDSHVNALSPEIEFVSGFLYVNFQDTHAHDTSPAKHLIIASIMKWPHHY